MANKIFTDESLVTFVNEIKSCINTKVDESKVGDWFGVGTSIPQNSDLNNYTTPGKYYVGSTAIAGTISNAPVNNTNYVLYVITRTTGKSISQIIFGLNNKIYMRSATASGTLGDWQTFITASDLSKYSLKTEVTNLQNYVDEKLGDIETLLAAI